MYLKLKSNPKSTAIPLNTNSNMNIITYDIDVLSRKVFYSTQEGLYLYNWGSGINSFENTAKINDIFLEPGKLRFDYIGKMLYISQPSGIYISIYPYKNFHRIINEFQIVNYEILPDLGYLILS